MKRFFLALFSMATLAASAQTADDIIQKYSTAMGGLEGFSKITSAKMTGNVKMQGNVLPVTSQVINNKAARTDVEYMGQTIVNVYFNGTGWKLNPFAPNANPVTLSGQELIDAKVQASLVNHLMDYKNRGHKVELLGQEDVEGIKCFKLNLTNKDDNKVTTYLISSTDYMLIKSVSTRDLGGGDMEVEVYYSDLKEINGLKFAMTRIQKAKGQVYQEIKLDKIELNVPIDENIFKM